MKTGIIIQARTSSTRLPGKVLKDLPFGSGITVLEQVIRRAKKSKKADAIIIATTEGKEDDPIVKIAQKEGARFFRGSRDDVLSRYHLAAQENGLDVIVRITSDCPCIDPQIIDAVISRHIRGSCDYTYNQFFAHGLDVEVCSSVALETAFRNARKDCEREHVTVYMQESHPERFKIGVVKAGKTLRRPGIRITLDTEEDYLLLCAVYDYLYPKNRYFDAREIVRLFGMHPWLSSINAGTYQKIAIKSVRHEIREAARFLKLYGFPEAARLLKRHRP
ncbi:MAG: glycosyltransferase family protein [Elusimicrobia bacterium]|nr:glycosyltransferase family protein [Elusimicrobiota bacterium]